MNEQLEKELNELYKEFQKEYKEESKKYKFDGKFLSNQNSINQVLKKYWVKRNEIIQKYKSKN